MKSQASMVVGQASWDRLCQWVRIRPISTILPNSSPHSKCSRIPLTSRQTLTTKQKQYRRGWIRQQEKFSVKGFSQRPRKMVLCSQFFWHPKVQGLTLLEATWWRTTWHSVLDRNRVLLWILWAWNGKSFRQTSSLSVSPPKTTTPWWKTSTK